MSLIFPARPEAVRIGWDVIQLAASETREVHRAAAVDGDETEGTEARLRNRSR